MTTAPALIGGGIAAMPAGHSFEPDGLVAARDQSKPDIGAAMIQNARITGQVEYREGDGANITIRPGPCEVDETALDATLSWVDGESHGSAAMPLADYRRYLASKAIQIVGVKGA